MSRFRDPAIKLFGKTISLPQNEKISVTTEASVTTSKASSASVSLFKQHCSAQTSILLDVVSSKGLNEWRHDDEEDEKMPSGGFVPKHENCSTQQSFEDLKHPTTSSGMCENPKTPSNDKETSSPKSPRNGEQSETSNSQENTLKKPDKIIPCPRCNSMDTKFCYYNNYNVNQPRHFCKNCQRYWTAGGTMRNVPVGAGRRKNKQSSASHYRHILVSEALQSARANAASNGLHHPTLVNNGTVLNFGPDAPFCESVASVLKIAENTQNCFPNRFHEWKEIGDDQSSNSKIVASNLTENGIRNAASQEQLAKKFQGFPLQVPCFPGPPWPPSFCPPGFPVSFCQPPTYWGCTLPGSWTIPWLSPQPNSPNHSFVSSSPSSPTLGKHSRDGSILNSLSNSEKEELLKENNSDRGAWIPKTLRIDDPSEAAKSSIWATLGIKNEKASSKNGGGFFRAFQSKGDHDENHIGDSLSVLQANPAAMSRSLNFHETT